MRDGARWRWGAAVPVAALLLALAADGAAAQSGSATVTLDPNLAGMPSTLRVTASGQGTSTGQELPRSVALRATKGFRVDPRSRAGRCSDQQAQSYSCPSDSRIGAGRVTGSVSGPLAPTGAPFDAAIALFLSPPQPSSDIAGVIVQVTEPSYGFRTSLRGRLLKISEDPFGLELRFETGGGQAPPGYTIRVDRLELAVGARRTIRRTEKTPSGRTRSRRIRYHLIRNPRTCAGSWPYQVRLEYAQRTETRDGTVACRSG